MNGCEKCGSDDVRVRFHSASDQCRPWAPSVYNTGVGEHLHHFCQVCGFDWTTPTKARAIEGAEAA